jgi:DNA-binding NtrC family response regulator/tetratricopeptide (TPR) repeat protein
MAYLASLVSWVGPDAGSSEIGAVRPLLVAAGRSDLTIKYRLTLAEMEAKRGALARAEYQLEVALGLLSRFGNAALEIELLLKQAAVAALEAQLSRAESISRTALKAAIATGSTSFEVVARANLAHILGALGQGESSKRELVMALELCRAGGGAELGIRDGFALHALEFESDETANKAIQAALELSTRLEEGRSYYGLWHLHTRVRWLLRTHRPDEALTTAEDALPHIERMADRNLLVRMQLITAEALGACGRPLDGATLLATALQQNPDPALDIIAEASRVAGCLAVDDRGAALDHFERAIRIFDALGHRTARDQTCRLAALPPGDRAGSAVSGPRQAVAPARAVETSAALTYLAKHPPLLGAEALTLLQKARACASAFLLEEDHTGARRIVDHGHERSSTPPRAVSPYGTNIPLGNLGVRHYALRVEACPGPAARSTLQAVERLVHASVTLARMRQEERERAALWPEQSPEEQLGLVHASEVMADLVKITRRVAPSDVTVLITGETGSGKEVFARALHQASARRDGPFMPFNCTTLPRDMLDSQLFGYRRGSFTGATQEYPGLIRGAEGGTLFLDEIGEMPLDLQPKLLRFLESGEIQPIGETRPLHVNVRVVAATNADLDRLVAEGRFREDLFYRLHVVRLKVPPLRERREEVPLLVRTLVERFAREHQREPIRFSDEALEFLTLYHWPGNARQLANELRRLIALVEPGALVMPEHLSPEIGVRRPQRAARDLNEAELLVRTDQPLSAAVEHLERVLIAQALDQCGGNVERAAQMLGLSRKGLFLKRQRLGLI